MTDVGPMVRARGYTMARGRWCILGDSGFRAIDATHAEFMDCTWNMVEWHGMQCGSMARHIASLMCGYARAAL